MIQPIDIKDPAIAQQVLEVQIPSYQVEAELIGFFGIPQLRDTTRSLMNCPEDFYGYFMDGNLAGAISFVKKDGVVDIHRLIVHPDYFRRGIGRSLVQYVLDFDKNIKKYIVSTGAKNIPAKNLYKKLGFVEIGEQEVAPGVLITQFEKMAV
ncbi:GNAT family N-acetyltransferase [Fictibacillus sp. Mic-4]|uniref:GNAT family N-acetyltransferase n=1 Tax=Fictibacillus sp. Mic-4 TaxID=3132826 RepID=UPI003CF80FF1